MTLKKCGSGKGDRPGVRVLKGRKSGKGKDAGASQQECLRCGVVYPVGGKHP